MSLRLPNRRGMTLPELLIAVVIIGIIFAFSVTKMATASDSASRRAARQQFIAAFAATRAAALQKGKTATLTLTSTSATVAVQSGLAGNATTVWGPLEFNTALNVIIEPLGGATSTISYSSRGLLTPTPGGILRYRLTVGASRDTVCISAAGLILPRGCQL